MSQQYNLGKVALTPKGTFNANATYERLDVVTLNGSSYLVLQSCTGITPPNATYYQLIASKGNAGTNGSAATIAAGTVTMLPVGSSATVTNSGTSSNAIFNFGIPKETFDTSIIADDYDATRTYYIGEYCIYSGVLYKAIVDITTAEAFTTSHWTAVSIGADAGVAIGQVLGSEIYPISTSGHIKLKAVGSEQETTPTSSTTYSCIVLPVKKGDSLSLYVSPDVSATSYKGYVFTDTNYTSIERCAVGDRLFGMEIIAPSNGFFIANSTASSKSFVVKNGICALKSVCEIVSDISDIYTKLSINSPMTATTESGVVYRTDYPYGTSASNHVTYSYSVSGLDVLSITISPSLTANTFKLAMWYDASGSYIGCTNNVDPSVNIPVVVPSRAATLRISAGSSATVSVKKCVIPVQTQKRVSMSGNVITIENDKYTYVMSKHGNNNLMDLYQVLAKDGTVIYTASTDWQGPYQVSAINNADGDAISQGATFTGGNHAYAFDGGSGTATARTSEIKVYADGTELADGQTLLWNDCVSVEWTNYVQGWNTKKSDGTGREILMESPSWRFRPSDRIETENRIEALEDIRIGLYYGLQMAAAWLGGGVLLPSARRSVIAMSEFTPSGLGTRFAGYNVTVLGTGINITMGYDPFVDIGDGNAITSDEIKLTRIHTSTSKCYVYMVHNYDLDNYEIMRYAGYYQFR